MSEKVEILIIDDDVDMLETLGDILQEKGYRTETANTGREAITKANERVFNVALIDVKLPDMSGIEVLQTFRKQHPSMMTIMMTGYATLQNAVDAVNLGAHAYIMKPLDFESLDQTIKKSVNNVEMPVSLRAPEVGRILQAIKESGITEFKPSFSYEKGIFYPDIEKIIPNSSINFITYVFEELEKHGIGRREFFDSNVICPLCGSHHLFVKFRCQICKSTNIEKQTAIQHLPCKYTDLPERFVKNIRNEEKLICPKCNRELKTLGVDYQKLEIYFNCGTCGRIRPATKCEYICGDCRESYSENQLKIIKFFTFVIRPKQNTFL